MVKKRRVKHNIKPPYISSEIDNEIHKREHLLKMNDEAQFRNIFFTKCKCNLETNKPFNQEKLNALSTESYTCTPTRLNLHFSNITSKMIKNDKTNENNLEALEKFCYAKNISSIFLHPTSISSWNSQLSIAFKTVKI